MKKKLINIVKENAHVAAFIIIDKPILDHSGKLIAHADNEDNKYIVSITIPYENNKVTSRVFGVVKAMCEQAQMAGKYIELVHHPAGEKGCRELIEKCQLSIHYSGVKGATQKEKNSTDNNNK